VNAQDARPGEGVPEQTRSGRPQLAVLYDSRSTFGLNLHGFVHDYCDLIWILDESQYEVSAQEKTLLRRLGTVVEIGGKPFDDAVRLVRESRAEGIVTFSDRRIRLVAALTDALGLAGTSPESAERLVSKYEQRKAFAKAGIATPRVWPVPSDSDPDLPAAIARDACMPLVLKPDEGDGSSNIHTIPDVDTLLKGLAEARASGRDVVVEEFIVGAPAPRPEVGDYVSVESVVSRGHVSHVAINGRFPVAWPFRETGFFIPALLPESDVAGVLDLAAEAIHAVGIEAGCTHTEIKLTRDGPRVIEVNGRIGGGVPEMLQLVTDVNLFEIAFRIAAGEDVRFDGLRPCSEVAYLFYVQAPAGAGEVTEIDGLDELQNFPGVASIRLNHPPGTKVDWHAGNHDYVYSVLGVAKSHDALIELAGDLDNKVVISYA
jgi:biotin carboxylase